MGVAIFINWVTQWHMIERLRVSWTFATGFNLLRTGQNYKALYQVDEMSLKILNQSIVISVHANLIFCSGNFFVILYIIHNVYMPYIHFAFCCRCIYVRWRGIHIFGEDAVWRVMHVYQVQLNSIGINLCKFFITPFSCLHGRFHQTLYSFSIKYTCISAKFYW